MKRLESVWHRVSAFLAVLLLLATGCNDSFIDRTEIHEYPERGEVTSSELKPVEISFVAPSLVTPSLRALSPAGENLLKDVSKVRAFVFKSAATGGIVGNCLYEAPVMAITPSTSDNGKTGKMTVSLKDSQGSSQIILFAVNATQVEDSFTAEGKSLEELTKALLFKPQANGEWTNGSLPMFAVSKQVVISHSSGAVPTLNTTIEFIRSVARVDVGINVSGEQYNEVSRTIDKRPHLVLSEVRFYNHNDKGQVFPVHSNLNVPSYSFDTHTSPALPDGVARQTSPLVFKQFNQNTLKRSIYVPEAENANAPSAGSSVGGIDYSERPTLVIGLTGLNGESDTKVNWYRIDFLKRTGNESTATYEYLHLLRNHRYLVNITNIDGPGFDTPEEALKGPAANIMYNVHLWNESDVSDVKYDGQYMLGVNPKELTFYAGAASKNATIITSWPKGWKAEVIEGADWITLDKNSSTDVDQDTPLKISVAKFPNTGEPNRVGVIRVTAGRITSDIQVLQLSEEEEALVFYDAVIYDESQKLEKINVLQFSAPDEEKEVLLYAAPKDQLELKLKGDKYFEYEKIEDLEGNLMRYKVKAKPVAQEEESFCPLIGELNAKIPIDPKNSLDAKLILLREIYNAIPYFDATLEQSLLEPNEDHYYLMDGELKSFYIKANAPYVIELVNYEEVAGGASLNNLIENGFNGELDKDGSMLGEKLDFTPVNDLADPKHFYGKAKFRIFSRESLFEPKEFSITLVSGIIQKPANSYMMKPGHIGILIPIKQIELAHDYYMSKWEQAVKFSTGTRLGVNPSTLNVADYAPKKVDKGQPWTVEPLWGETRNMNYVGAEQGAPQILKENKADYGILRALKPAGDYIFVMPGAVDPSVGIENSQANVVIALKQNSEILWSWHLWLVDKYPSEDPLTRSNSNRKWLKRDLGALADNTSKDIDKNKLVELGLMYQWGRKDPFPLLNGNFIHILDGRATKFLSPVNNDGKFQYVEDDKGKSVHFTTCHPHHMVGAGRHNSPHIEHPNDHYDTSNDALNVTNAFLWGGAVTDLGQKLQFKGNHFGFSIPTEKTPFDPSPYGWKVHNIGSESPTDGGESRDNTGYRLHYPTVKSGIGTFYKNNPDPCFPGLTPSSEVFRLYSTRNRGRVAGSYFCGADGKVVKAVNDHYSPSMAAMVRSVDNEKETDYEKYLPKKKLD